MNGYTRNLFIICLKQTSICHHTMTQHCVDVKAFTYSSSWFSEVHQEPPIEQFCIDDQFKKDQYEFKIDLAFSTYRDEELKPWVFPVVRTTERVIVNDSSLAKEYLATFGYESFRQAALRILLGDDHPARLENRAFSIQTLSATGSLRIGAEFLNDILGLTTFYRAEQSLQHVNNIFPRAGFTESLEYRYFNRYTLLLDIESMLKDLSQAEEGSVVLLQPCGHNPTGCDPTQAEWKRIAEVIQKNKLFPFFDCAYQGFVSGDFDQDAWALRYFASQHIEFFCAQSFAKNFSLYNERVGALTVVLNTTDKVNAVKSHLVKIIKGIYATPPSHGARIVAFILGDKTLKDQLKNTIESIAERLKRMRMYLREELERSGAPGTWVHITSQVGNFCYTGFNDVQVQHMRKQHHIYMPSSGRLTLSGLNPDNVEYVARAMTETLQMIPPSYIMKKSVIGSVLG